MHIALKKKKKNHEIALICKGVILVLSIKHNEPKIIQKRKENKMKRFHREKKGKYEKTEHILIEFLSYTLKFHVPGKKYIPEKMENNLKQHVPQPRLIPSFYVLLYFN